jgi:ATP-dependent Clp protease protease subunit
VSGQASDIEIVNNEIQILKKELFTILSEHSGNNYDNLVAMGDRDKWLTAREAVDLGFIDKVITRE